MPLEIAPHAGFCMGVRRAVKAAEAVANEGKRACTLGELIHNPQVVEALRARGIVPVRTPEEAAGQLTLIRSHGVTPDTLEALKALGCEVLDLTCPFVDRLHHIAAEAVEKGRTLIVVGEREHPEVVGTVGWAQGRALVIATPAEAKSVRTEVSGTPSTFAAVRITTV